MILTRMDIENLYKATKPKRKETRQDEIEQNVLELIKLVDPIEFKVKRIIDELKTLVDCDNLKK
jgi:hypothetical protein